MPQARKTTATRKTVSDRPRKQTGPPRKRQIRKEPPPPEVEEVEEEVEVIEEVEEVEEVEEETPDTKKKTRRVVNRETILAEFDAISALLDSEISRLRSVPDARNKVKGVKTLRTVNKRVKTLRNDSARALKTKQRTKRTQNNRSGFMKPVQISKEMAKFTGWDPKELKSRVDVTKYLCEYVKKKDLQDPADRRRILADKKLAALLNFDEEKDGQPLTYFFLQKKIQPHFLKPTGTAVATK
jgi:upstream activation factor subunit UAF30